MILKTSMITTGDIEFFKHQGTSSSLTSAIGPGGLISASIDQQIHRNSTFSKSKFSRQSNDILVEDNIKEDSSDEGEEMSEEIDDSKSMPVVLSIWSLLNGYHLLGCLTIKNNISSQLNIKNDSSIIAWNSTGDLICVLLFGEILILDILWKYKNNNEICNYFKSSLNQMDLNDDETPNNFACCDLSIKLRRQLEAVSLCICNNSKCLLVGSDRGNIFLFSISFIFFCI